MIGICHIDDQLYLADLSQRCFRHVRDQTDVIRFESRSGRLMAAGAGMVFCYVCEAPLVTSHPPTDRRGLCPLCQQALAHPNQRGDTQ